MLRQSGLPDAAAALVQTRAVGLARPLEELITQSWNSSQGIPEENLNYAEEIENYSGWKV
jgi:hypothetical protein